MTIPVGTLCLLVRTHEHCGKTCTVTGVARNELCRLTWGPGPSLWEVLPLVYTVDIPGVSPTYAGMLVGATHDQLFPLAPPGVHDDEKHDVSVHA